MRLAAAASTVHKWVGLIVSIQVLFWIASGLFFAVYPIERVRSEHRIAEAEIVAINLSPAEFGAALRAFPQPPAKLAFERDALGGVVAVAEFDGAPAMLASFDDAAAVWRVASPLDRAGAEARARAHVQDAPPVRHSELIDAETTEYRGPLPAWRVTFEDGQGLVVYVAAHTGRVVARRSDLWRVYDALWALHIMDWRNHEDFNHGLIILASVLALAFALSGFILFPYRFGWLRPRRPLTNNSPNA